MTETERTVARDGAVLVVGIASLVGPIAVTLAAINPVLWLVAALGLVVGGATIDSTRTVQASGDVRKTNCPNCGARVPTDRPRCEYCGEPLPDSTGYQQTLGEWVDEETGRGDAARTPE